MLGGRRGGSPPEPAPRDPHLDHIHRAVLVARWTNRQQTYAQIWATEIGAQIDSFSMAIQGPHDAWTGYCDLTGGRHMYVQRSNVSDA